MHDRRFSYPLPLRRGLHHAELFGDQVANALGADPRRIPWGLWIGGALIFLGGAWLAWCAL
jgi:hypothetical protein